MKLHPIWNDYPQLQDELQETLALMEKSIQLKDKAVEKAILEMIHSGGKLLRPAYQLLFSRFGPKQDQQKAVALAASIELLHTATLIHDDIVDEASLRRGLPTIHASFDNSTAVYAGDYLFVICFKLMSSYASSMRSLQTNAKSMEKILSGELGQMDDRYNLKETVEEYIENVAGKTAELFSLSCAIGTFESGSSQAFSKKAATIGLNIGISFQIVDDILDYSRSTAEIGKPVLADMKQGVYSLPLIYALQKDCRQLIPLLAKKEQMTTADTQLVYQKVHQLGGVKQAQLKANEYTQLALKAIQKLPDDKQATRQTLYQLTQDILKRNN
ncbi:MAG TPA: polyprenyl synthetase family protein [Tetragenococcus sp.]|nr:polyprenyl synthetase family protein [Tetragenococcus sp.]